MKNIRLLFLLIGCLVLISGQAFDIKSSNRFPLIIAKRHAHVKTSSLERERQLYDQAYASEQNITLTGVYSSGSMMQLEYEGLEGSNPKKFGYFVAIWQSDKIQSLDNALTIQKIKLKTQDGSFVFKNLGLNPLEYIIGFGVNIDNDYSICSTLSIPENVEIGDILTSEPSKIEIVDQGTNSLIAHFQTPPFNLAKTNKNWIALFRGRFTSNVYSKKNLIHYTLISDNTNEGYVALNNIPEGLIFDEVYTLVYGMGVNDKSVATGNNIVAAITFKATARQ